MARSTEQPCNRCGWRAPVGKAYCDECMPWIERWGSTEEKALAKGIPQKRTGGQALSSWAIPTMVALGSSLFSALLIVHIINTINNTEREKTQKIKHRDDLILSELSRIDRALSGSKPATLGEIIRLVGPYSTCGKSRGYSDHHATWVFRSEIPLHDSRVYPARGEDYGGEGLNVATESCDNNGKVLRIDVWKRGTHGLPN